MAAWPPSWFGSIRAARSDTAERTEDILAAEFPGPAPCREEHELSAELAATIREALAAAERGETDDLGSFAQYALDEDC